MPELIGVVVLYHPGSDLKNNIATYIHEVDRLLVIDNSEKADPRPLLDHPDKIIYIRNDDNMGMAYVLNQAATIATEHNYTFLLTMDQDSRFAPGALAAMKSWAFQSDQSVAIVAPYHATPGSKVAVMENTIDRLKITMTSGNLLRLSAFNACGPFDTRLFIDSVDHEYCLRVRSRGYAVIRFNNAVLFHQLGSISYRSYLGWRLKTTNHSAQRRYYITRNRLYVMFKYAFFDPWFFFRELREYVKDPFRIIFLEAHKRLKMLAWSRGTLHFLQRKFGKI